MRVCSVAASLAFASLSLAYTCPSTDSQGYPLGIADDYNGTNPNPASPDDGYLFCSYPTNEGDDPNEYYCERVRLGLVHFWADRSTGFCAVTVTFGVSSTTLIELIITDATTAVRILDGNVSTLIYSTASASVASRRMKRAVGPVSSSPGPSGVTLNFVPPSSSATTSATPAATPSASGKARRRAVNVARNLVRKREAGIY
ncbi:hypothetical protein RQP46_011464 [Phenoliferia psychrophenolica]